MSMMFVLDKVNLASHMRQSSVPLLNAFSFFLLPLFKQIIRENNFNLELLLIYNIKVMFGKICDLGVMSVKNFLLWKFLRKWYISFVSNFFAFIIQKCLLSVTYPQVRLLWRLLYLIEYYDLTLLCLSNR